MRIVERRTVRASRDSVKISFSSGGRKPEDVDRETSLEWLANYQDGRVPLEEVRQRLLVESRARIFRVYYSLPDGRAIYRSFDWYVRSGRPKTIDVVSLTGIRLRNHRR